MDERAPISVIIPTLNAAERLPSCLAALAPAAIAGLVREVVVSDGGSWDATRAIAEAAGARVVVGDAGRGAQLARGASASRGRWFLFLHADTVLEKTWRDEARALIDEGESRAGVFTLRFDRRGVAPFLVAAGAMLRTRTFAAPYGDQGLLVSRAVYDEVGGYRQMVLFEDVDLIDRLIRLKGRGALRVLKSRATTSAERYARDGYARRVVKNAYCFSLYRLGVAPEKIARIYK
jgi:rSAM/selenodomain-associated transferase 2